MTRRATILLADDHALLTEGLARLLEPRFEIVGTVADGHALVSRARELQPDVVLIDIAMPVLDGIEAGRRRPGEAPGGARLFLPPAPAPPPPAPPAARPGPPPPPHTPPARRAGRAPA